MRFRFVARLGPDGSRLQSFMIGSFVVHTVAIIVFTVVPALRKPPAIDFDKAFTVELTGGIPSGPAPQAQAPAPAPVEASPPASEPEPEVEPEPEGAHIEERQVVETKKPPKDPDPEPEPAPRKPRPSPTPAETSDATGGGDPDGGLVLEKGSAGIGGGLEMGGSELSWYNSAVAAALYNNWRQPGVAFDEPLIVVVDFLILRDGTVRGTKITQGSGVGTVDRSVLRAITNASPLPPIPPTWSGSTISASYRFILNSEE